MSALLGAVGGCDRLSETECLGLRSEAFDVVNESHPCADDTDCRATEWPLCPKPSSTKNYQRIAAVKAKFDKGKCTEPEKKCRETPEVYCKQGLCVFRERPGAANPVDAK